MASRGTDDIFNNVCIKLGIGVLYKTVARLRSVIDVCTIRGFVVRAIITRKKYLKGYVPI